MNPCPKCGRPGGAWVTHVCMTAGRLTDPPAKQAVGWTCPTCGNGNAPWMPYCHNCDSSTRTALPSPASSPKSLSREGTK